MNTIASEGHEAGEKEHVGNARTKSAVVDSLDIRVARGKDDSASHEERNSSAEDEPERFRPNLAHDAAQLRKTLEKRAEARKGKPPGVARTTRQTKKGKKAASACTTESDSKESSESDEKSESCPEASEEETAAEPAGSGSDSGSSKQRMNTRRRVGRPRKQAQHTQVHQQGAFAAGIERGKKKEASLMAPVQRAIVSANLSKRAKSAEDHSVKGKEGNKRAHKTGSTAKAGGLRDNIYK